MQLLNISGQQFVEELPEEMVEWIFDSAVVLAVQDGTIEQEQAMEFLNPKCPDCPAILQEVIKEVPVEKIV